MQYRLSIIFFFAITCLQACGIFKHQSKKTNVAAKESTIPKPPMTHADSVANTIKANQLKKTPIILEVK